MLDSYVSQTIGYLTFPDYSSNLTLTFKSGTNQFVEDAVGNLIPVSTDVVVTAAVTDDSQPRLIPEIAETGQQIMRLKGHLTSNLPSTINYQSIANGVLTDSQGFQVIGVWRFTPVVQNRISTYLTSRNKFIKGTLTIATKV